MKGAQLKLAVDVLLNVEELAFGHPRGRVVHVVILAYKFFIPVELYYAGEANWEVAMPVPQNGWVLHLRRIEQQKRNGLSYQRTVGRYKVFHDGMEVSGLSGWFAERNGPGDNTLSGNQHDRRIREGRYRLSTHKGGMVAGNPPKSVYVTHGYSTVPNHKTNLRPSFRLLDTGQRAGILAHPGSGWLWSVGCFNPAADLSTASSNIGWLDSRSRMIALIDDMRAYLGAQFPSQNNVEIPRALMVIEGEPSSV